MLSTLIQNPIIGGNGSTYPTNTIGYRTFYPGTNCQIEYVKADPASSVPIAIGGAVGTLRASVAAGSVAGYTSGNTAGAVTGDLSRSDSVQFRGIALNTLSISSGTYRFGWVMTSGNLKDLNRALARDGIASVAIKCASVAKRSILNFNADNKLGTIAATTITAARGIKGVGRAFVAGSSSTSLTDATIGTPFA